MYNTSPDDLHFVSLLRKEKKKFARIYEATLKSAEDTLNSIKEAVTLSNLYTLEKNSLIWNTACYISIISMDLKIISRHQAFSENEWERRYFSRQAALLIYESIDDILHFLGAPLKKISYSLSLDDEHILRLKSIRADLNNFKKTHSSELQRIRNTAIAHRDKKTIEQLTTIYSISWFASINLCNEYDLIINKIGNFLEQIMRKGITDGETVFSAY